MRFKFLVATTLIVPSFLVAASTLVFADGIQIKNASSIDIDNLTVSPPGQNAWGQDLLKGAPPRVLDAGKSYVVNSLKPGTYDFRSYDEDTGKDCVIKGVTVKKSAGAVITEAMTASCGS
jgi:hypothetical protein